MKNSIISNQFSLKRLLPYITNINFGIFLISTHIFLDLGAFQQLLDFVVPMNIPFITTVSSAAYAAFLMFSGKFRPFSSKLSTSCSLFFAFIFIYSMISSINIANRNNSLKLLLVYYSNFVIASCCVKTIFQLSLILDAYLFAILHACYHGIRQGGLIWSSKWLGDENAISVMVICAIPFSFMLFLLYKNLIRKIVYAIITAACITLVIIANSRGGAIALAVCGLFCWGLSGKKLRSLVLTSLAIMAIFIFAPSKWFNELKTIKQGTEESTAFDRMYGWKLATLMFKDFPVSGVGMFNYPEYYVPYNIQYRLRANRAPNRDPHMKRVAHSTPIEWIAETGLIGIVFFILLLSSFYSNWKQLHTYCKNAHGESSSFLNTHNNSTAVAVIAFWVGASFISILLWPFLWTLLLFSVTGRNIYLQMSSAVTAESI